MSIDIDTARKVAHLARIAVKEADLPKLAGELSAVLAFMEQLNDVDVTGIDPMAPASPQPLTPSPLWVQGVLQEWSTVTKGTSSARGIA